MYKIYDYRYVSRVGGYVISPKKAEKFAETLDAMRECG